MSFSQVLKIENKIFKKSDILHIWEEISQNGETELTLTFHDCIECSSKKDEILNDGKIIDQKKCERIKIECNNFLDKKFISFELNAEYSTGSLRIKSEDQDWNSGNLERLSGKINSLPKHPEWIRKFRYRFPIVFATLIIIATLSIFPPDLFIFNKYLIRSIYTILLFILLFILLILPLIFPNIEFDFGPEDKKFAKKWRNNLKMVLKFIFGTLLFGGVIMGVISTISGDYFKENWLKKPESQNSQNSNLVK